MGLFAVTKGLGQSDYANDFVESNPERMSTRHLVDVRLKRLSTVYRHRIRWHVSCHVDNVAHRAGRLQHDCDAAGHDSPNYE